jgi:hypothetical protein
MLSRHKLFRFVFGASITGFFLLQVMGCQGLSAHTVTPIPIGSLPSTRMLSPRLTPTIAKTPTDSPTVTSRPSPTMAPTITNTPTPTVESILHTATPNPKNSIHTVFLMVMENEDWSSIKGNPAASYINNTLLLQAAYAQQYYNPPGNHPSLPNYLWLEAGTNFGIKNDSPPSENHQSTKDHLVTYLEKAGIRWRAYQEGISGKDCPLRGMGLYTPRHNPSLYFDDVTGGNNPTSQYCINHERPFSELKSDLANNTVASYNFITPNLCHNMHNEDGCSSGDRVKNGDQWLSEQVPMILNSQAFKDGGVLFITWDESENGDQPIGMIVLSPFVKGGGYSNTIHYTHSSTLRTIQEIFGVMPFLGGAADSNDLSDLFRVFP